MQEKRSRRRGPGSPRQRQGVDAHSERERSGGGSNGERKVLSLALFEGAIEIASRGVRRTTEKAATKNKLSGIKIKRSCHTRPATTEEA